MSLLRSLLFVPGNQTRRLDKAIALEVVPDAVVPDLEDSVPEAEKENARATVASYLPRLADAGALVVPRVNGLASGLFYDDLEAVVGSHIFAVSVGKIASADEMTEICDAVEVRERRAGLPEGSIRLLVWIETARAVMHAAAICALSPRLVGAAFGAEDFAHDMGAGGPGELDLDWPRAAVAVAARAAGVPALDTPCFAFRDEEALRREALAARRLGYKGKFAIHPQQVAGINACFSPSEADLEYAARVVAAFEEAERGGYGATSLDGRVIDVPVVKRARALLAAAQSTGR